MKQLPIGTKVKFLRTLDASANEDHPDIVYAYKGELGVIITGRDTPVEGYWAIVESRPNLPFGATANEFEVMSE